MNPQMAVFHGNREKSNPSSISIPIPKEEINIYRNNASLWGLSSHYPNIHPFFTGKQSNTIIIIITIYYMHTYIHFTPHHHRHFFFFSILQSLYI